MPDPTHFVLTKYNVALTASTGPSRGLDGTWLEQRLALFTQWTATSMRMQTVTPNAWMIFIDHRTPNAMRTAIRIAAGGIARLVPVCGPLTDPMIAAETAGLLHGSGTLITTRLDNDDAIASDYLARVRAAAAGRGGLLGFVQGYRLSGGRVFRSIDSATPFINFVEPFGPNETLLTVFQAPHHQLAWHGLVTPIPGPPAWLQVVHGANIANGAIGLLWPSSRAARQLGLSLPRPEIAVTQTVLLSIVALMRQITLEIEAAVRRSITTLRRRGRPSPLENELDNVAEVSSRLRDKKCRWSRQQ